MDAGLGGRWENNGRGRKKRLIPLAISPSHRSTSWGMGGWLRKVVEKKRKNPYKSSTYEDLWPVQHLPGYFDDVTTVIQGGSSSVKALTGSTEEEQFH
ncbi:MAG: hypothetical protein B7Y20_12680 [Acidovorax sp. 16-64-162]|uniref:hypothetical protein n=1 Tax=Acidovorax sp. 16-64-162 TaxID=1970307 RepID=UPI000BC96728|nr:hypothetical protein [Acidovorax sp. 16-64-162]OYZ44062.1 MAG: hypothetical protein B7Y20_12680 [Acidovorax sp. 16-64-162]